MVKVIHLADDGTEMATIEVDDFTIEVIYAGIAEMLREAAVERERGGITWRAAPRSAPAPREDPPPHPRRGVLTGWSGTRRSRGSPWAGFALNHRWTWAERARRYAGVSCPPTWRTSSPPTGPGPRPTAARSADLVEEAASTPPPRDFAGALRVDGLSCIAEIKRRSPSKGDLDPGLQPDLVANEYVDGGAACLSVLTDVDFFGGSPADLASARQASWPPGVAQGLHGAARRTWPTHVSWARTPSC